MIPFFCFVGLASFVGLFWCIVTAPSMPSRKQFEREGRALLEEMSGHERATCAMLELDDWQRRFNASHGGDAPLLSEERRGLAVAFLVHLEEMRHLAEVLE